MTLDLSRVTLVTICARDYEDCRVVLSNCQAVANFSNTIIFTDDPNEFPGFDCIEVEPRSRIKWCIFRMTEMLEYIKHFADFVLFVESDSIIANPSAWSEEFFEYDMIGSPWHDGVVGNWGFALFSKLFLSALESLKLRPTLRECSPCDWLGSRIYRPKLEALGCKFAPFDVANKFASETGAYAGAFGVHGIAMLKILKNNMVGVADQYGKLAYLYGHSEPVGGPWQHSPIIYPPDEFWRMPAWSPSFIQPLPPLADQSLCAPTPPTFSSDYPPLAAGSEKFDISENGVVKFHGREIKSCLADAVQRSLVCMAAREEWLRIAHNHGCCGNGAAKRDAEAHAGAWETLLKEKL